MYVWMDVYLSFMISHGLDFAGLPNPLLVHSYHAYSAQERTPETPNNPCPRTPP